MFVLSFFIFSLYLKYTSFFCFLVISKINMRIQEYMENDFKKLDYSTQNVKLSFKRCLTLK